MAPKVSVVMPVYNGQDHLAQCVESVLAQTLRDIEVICVDDGSTDDSPAILERLAARDGRLRVVRQSNGGAGAARNNGLRLASGEYLSFLDSDDFFEPDMLERACAAADASRADFVVYRSDQFREDTGQFVQVSWTLRERDLPPYRPMSFRQFSGNVFKTFVGWPWDKLYRRSFVEAHGLTFQEQRTTNDMLFVFSALVLAERIEVVDAVLAHQRRNNPKSLSNTREKSWMCFYNALTALREVLRREGLYDALECDYVNYALHACLWNFNTISGPCRRRLFEALVGGWFADLGIEGRPRDYFDDAKEYGQYLRMAGRSFEEYEAAEEARQAGGEGAGTPAAGAQAAAGEGVHADGEPAAPRVSVVVTIRGGAAADEGPAAGEGQAAGEGDAPAPGATRAEAAAASKPAAGPGDAPATGATCEDAAEASGAPHDSDAPAAAGTSPLAARVRETVESVRAQTLADLECLCVLDGADEPTRAAVREFAAADGRVHVLEAGGDPQAAGGSQVAGDSRDAAARDPRDAAARDPRDAAAAAASGDYLLFLEPGCVCEPDLLARAVACGDAELADVVGFDVACEQEGVRARREVCVQRGWLSGDAKVFSWRQCPERIMNAASPVVRDKLLRRSFVRRADLRFSGSTRVDEAAFAACALAAAERIATVDGTPLRRTLAADLASAAGAAASTGVTDSAAPAPAAAAPAPAAPAPAGGAPAPAATAPAPAGGTPAPAPAPAPAGASAIPAALVAELAAAPAAVERVVAHADALPQAKRIAKSAPYFAMELCLQLLARAEGALDAPEVAAFYEYVRGLLARERFACLDRRAARDDAKFNRILAVREHDADAYRALHRPRLVASLTSYPARIGTLAGVLQSVYAQTRPADEVVLWLAGSQFPGGEESLPVDLRKLVSEGRLAVRWCADLKPHKKYFYALREFPDDIIVTLDDDLLYPPTLFERLYESYLLHPRAVSAARAHLMTFDEGGQPAPYRQWVMEVDGLLYEPSMQLFATGGAGALYPPGLIDERMLDEAAVRACCLRADDVWLKAAEVVSGVPVVVAQPYRPLVYAPGTQDEALYHDNVDGGGNDRQLAQAAAWVDGRFGEGTFRAGLLESGIGVDLGSAQARAELLAREHDRAHAHIDSLNRRLQQTYDEKSQLNRRLQEAFADKSQLNAKLQQTYREKSERGEQIKRLEARVKELEAQLADARGARAHPGRR